MSFDADHIRLERRGGVGLLTIDRPQALNALNAQVLDQLGLAFAELTETGSRAVIITGTGTKAFCAGADLGELEGLSPRASAATLSRGQRLFHAIEASGVPTIAAVNGLALGGGFELALACTFMVLSDHASLGLPESGLGLIPGYGGTQRLPTVIGRPAAAHIMLTGERLTARRSFELGLTPLAPVPIAALAGLSWEIAEKIASRGPMAQAAILSALRTSIAGPSGHQLEASLAAIATSSEEAAEGIAAFRAKRPAIFVDRRPTGEGRG